MDWKEYERKVGDYFRRRGYNVAENKRVKGKSGAEYEIDVLAEDYFGLIRIACQCKAWNEKVSREEILKWNSICEDISAKPAFASLSGYDKSALEVAKNFKFILLEGLELIHPKILLTEEMEDAQVHKGKKYYEMAFSEEDETKASEYARKAVGILEKIASESVNACLMLADLHFHFLIEEQQPEKQLEIGYEFLKQAITKLLEPIQAKLKDVSSTILSYYPLTGDSRLLDTARSFLTLYTALNPPDSEVFEMLGDCYEYSNDWQKAELYYKLALKFLGLAKSKNEASKVRILTKIAEIKEKMGKLDEAEEYYNKAIEIDPKDYKAIKKLAELKEKKEQLDDAIRLYEQLSKLYPENHHPTWNLARIHFMKSTGFTASTRWHISPTLFYKDELKRAIEYLTEAHKRLPESFKILEDLALCYFLLGDYDKAKEYKERAEKLRLERKRSGN